MAEASKGSKDPVLEEKFLQFLKGRVERYGTLSIKNLTGHLSALSPRVRNHFGASRSCLKQFLNEHSNDFYVDKKDNVKLVTDEARKNDVETNSNHTSTRSDSISESENLNKISESISDKSVNFPKELNDVRGKIYRMFPAFGFISVTHPVVCSVYFNLSCFENGKGRMPKEGHDIGVGEGVFLNAKRGPDNCEAHYRATRVWRVDCPSRKSTCDNSKMSEKSSPTPSCSSKGSTPKASAKREIYGKGKIDKLFLKFGFITQNKGLRDNVFFHIKTFHTQGEKKLTNLLEVLQIGDMVHFSAVPTEQKNALVQWQATHVWTDAEEMLDGSDIYFSSPEGSETSDSVYSLPLVNQTAKKKVMVQQAANGKVASTNGLVKHSSEPSNNLDDSLAINSSDLRSGSPSTTRKPFLTGQTGTIWPHSESVATIMFGNNQKALVLVDVFYQCEERIDNFIWELEDGQRIQFEAVEDFSWEPNFPWKVLLAWVGHKPDVDTLTSGELKEIYAKVQPLNSWDLEGNEEWQEPENAPIDDEDDEDFVEENMDDDLPNENLEEDLPNENDVEDDGIENPSDVSANDDGNALEDDGFVENLADSFPQESTSSSVSLQNHVESEPSSHNAFPEVKSPRGKLKAASVQESTAMLKMDSLPLGVFTRNPAPEQAQCGSLLLERQVQELINVVHDLMKRIPVQVQRAEKSTQTEEAVPSRSSEVRQTTHLSQSSNKEVQTLSTGPLMYTNLYHSQ